MHLDPRKEDNREYWIKFLLEEGQFPYPAAGVIYEKVEAQFGGVNKLFHPHTVAKTATNIVLVERGRIRALDLG